MSLETQCPAWCVHDEINEGQISYHEGAPIPAAGWSEADDPERDGETLWVFPYLEIAVGTPRLVLQMGEDRAAWYATVEGAQNLIAALSGALAALGESAAPAGSKAS